MYECVHNSIGLDELTPQSNSHSQITILQNRFGLDYTIKFPFQGNISVLIYHIYKSLKKFIVF